MKETIAIAGGHPDDLVGSLGLALLLKDRFDLHVLDFTRGEVGWYGHNKEETARVRTAEEQSVCAELGATPHFLGEVDGDAYANREVVARTAALLRELGPRAIIMHWPLDSHMDHVMSTAATLKAVWTTHPDPRKDFPEIYFFEETSQSLYFHPVFYVDITPVWERKVELMRKYACQNSGDGIVRNKTEDALFRGNQFWVDKAEAYAPYIPPRPGSRCIFTEIQTP